MTVAVAGVELAGIEARRYGRRGDRVEPTKIETNSTVTTVDRLDDTKVQMEFRFTVNYGPAGTIVLTGNLQLTGEATERDSIVEQWQSKGTMASEVASVVHSAVVAFCLTEAVVIARDLRLRPPFPIPQIAFGKKGGGKGAKAGVSPAGIEVA